MTTSIGVGYPSTYTYLIFNKSDNEPLSGSTIGTFDSGLPLNFATWITGFTPPYNEYPILWGVRIYDETDTQVFYYEISATSSTAWIANTFAGLEGTPTFTFPTYTQNEFGEWIEEEYATSSPDAYASIGCNNLSCSVWDSADCFKEAMCWAFVPRIGKLATTTQLVSDLRYKVPLGYGVLALESFQELEADTKLSAITIPFGTYGDITFLDFNALKFQEEMTQIEEDTSFAFNLVMAVFFGIYLIGASQRLLGNAGDASLSAGYYEDSKRRFIRHIPKHPNWRKPIRRR